MIPEKTHGQETADVVRKRYHLCPSCGHFAAFEEHHSYCMVCGATLIDKCAECYEPIIYPTVSFCPSCGNRMIGSSGSDDKATPDRSPR